MITLNVFFWLMIIITSTIGSMRGWAKELMVTFSVIVALFILEVLAEFVPPARPFLTTPGEVSFWANTVFLIGLSYFGYQSPNIPKLGGARFARERLQDSLFGLVLGAINGYLIVGSIWHFMVQAGYPYPEIVLPPNPGSASFDAVQGLIESLPPVWLTGPSLYFAVAISFAFVVIVFL